MTSFVMPGGIRFAQARRLRLMMVSQIIRDFVAGGGVMFSESVRRLLARPHSYSLDRCNLINAEGV